MFATAFRTHQHGLGHGAGERGKLLLHHCTDALRLTGSSGLLMHFIDGEGGVDQLHHLSHKSGDNDQLRL
ncbi:hypothetical protein ACX80S_02670 [Arthrobacter sp. RHLT1-20]